MKANADETIRQVMSDVLNLDVKAIRNETSMANTPLWDSANHIQLVLALEEELSISFDVAEFESMRSYADIVRTVGSKLAGQSV